MFPVTLNGNTYNAVDFQGSDTARNFGRFAFDLFQDKSNPSSAGNSIATSVTSNTYTTGAKTFTIASGKKFTKGMPVAISRVGDAVFSAMYGYVTDYVGTTLSVTVDSVESVDSTASTSWIIAEAMPVSAVSGTVSIADGGTGQTTGEAAQEALALPKFNTRPEVFNDMEGGPAFDLTDSEIWPSDGHTRNGLLIFTGKSGRVRNNVMAEAYAAGVPDLDKHPGLIELSVKNYRAGAAILGGSQGFVDAYSSDGVLFEACVYIPEMATSGPEQFDLFISLVNAGNDLVSSIGFVNWLNESFTHITPANVSVALNVADQGSAIYSNDQYVPLTWTGVPGWFVASIYMSAGDVSAAVTRDGESVVSADGASVGGTQVVTPMIMLYKKSGSTKEFKVYVDYWYVGVPASASALSRL